MTKFPRTTDFGRQSMFRVLLTCVLTLLLAGVAGCSYVLDAFANPDAPVFQLFVTSEGSLDRLRWDASSLSRAVPADEDALGRDRSWEMLYGYYVFVSTNTPYDGYRLAARLLNQSIVSNSWQNHEWNSLTGKWFDTPLSFAPVDGLGHLPLTNAWTGLPSTRTQYYRVVIIALKRNISEVRNDKDERIGDSIVYTLGEMGVSGWGAP